MFRFGQVASFCSELNQLVTVREGNLGPQDEDTIKERQKIDYSAGILCL